VLVVGAIATIVAALLRNPRALRHCLPGAVFMLSGGALFGLPIFVLPWTYLALIAGAAAVVLDLVVASRGATDTPQERAGAAPASAAYLGATLLVAAVLLFHDLGGFARTLQRWEAGSIGGVGEIGPCVTVQQGRRLHCAPLFAGFAHAFEIGQSIGSYAAQRFVWGEGLLSGGWSSLFYGAPTYALFNVMGFSAWTMRLSAAIALLLSIVVIYALARRSFGPTVAGAAAVLLGLNHCALFYGRYGSSTAGTILAVLIAVWCTYLFLDARSSAWWMGGVCSAALYLATLQYGPGRIVVLFLLGFIPLVLVCQWRRLSRSRVIGFAVIVAACGAVWQLQGWAGAREMFLSARGEQFLYMMSSPDYQAKYVASRCPRCGELRATSESAYRIELLRSWVEDTSREYVALIDPRAQSGPLGDWPGPALPVLYYGPLFLFIVWGAAHSCVRWRSPPHACLLLWVGVSSLGLLLTNRVDSHRIALLVIPISLWGALGIEAASRVMTRAKVPRPLQHCLAIALAVTVVANDVDLLWASPGPEPSPAQIVANEIAAVPGLLAVGALIDTPDESGRNVGFVALAMLERERLDPTRTGFFLSRQMLLPLSQGSVASDGPEFTKLQDILRTATVILAPAGQFEEVAGALHDRGVRVVERGTAEFRVLRLDAGPGTL
jgi:hypothetical protein